MLQQVVEAYGCSLVEGVLSHQLKQFVIDGNKCVLSKVSTASTSRCVLGNALVSCLLVCARDGLESLALQNLSAFAKQ